MRAGLINSLVPPPPFKSFGSATGLEVQTLVSKRQRHKVGESRGIYHVGNICILPAVINVIIFCTFIGYLGHFVTASFGVTEFHWFAAFRCQILVRPYIFRGKKP